MMDTGALAAAALAAREKAYAPYSGYTVGAALLCGGGRVYTGCNIECASFSPTCCAERVAIFQAVSAGERDFLAIAVAGGAQDEQPADYFYPCGVCRQVMMEFCNPDAFWIYTVRSQEDVQPHLLRELLPHGFGPTNMGR